MNPLSTIDFPLAGNRLIEASAGTGKTYTITNLYLRLLLGRNDSFVQPLPVNEILVLTFTIAATAELRTRIRRRIVQARSAIATGDAGEDEFLAQLLAGTTDGARDQRLLTAALQLMDEAAIYTIHGFCARVLSDNAFETGTLFDQNLDADRDVLFELAAQDCFRSEILTLPNFERSIALALWPSPEALMAKLKPFLFRAGLTLLPPAVDVTNALAELVENIRAAKAGWLKHNLPDIIRDAGFRATSKALSRLDAMTEWCRNDDLYTDLWENWYQSYLESVLNKNGQMPSHPVLELIEQIRQGEAAVQQAQFNLWHRMTARVRENLERYKVELSQLTLDDLLVKVHEALHQPVTGAFLAGNLVARWPIALIDEFQDTDDIQYAIFRAIYQHQPEIVTGLHFVGDPKQAIYQFRGADVFTYINARREVNPDTGVFSLTTNWRSTAPLVEAMNRLFDQPDIFDNDEDMPFVPVTPAPGSGERAFTEAGTLIPPITLFEVTASEGKLTKDPARRLVMDYAAEETVRLLSAAPQAIQIDGEPLHAGHIAFLVRDKNDARAARDALAARNIRSVYVTLESVFLTETADDLRLILQAALEPTNERALRAALAVPLMQSTASEIDALSHDVTAQQQVLQEFLLYHQLWATMDVAAMLERLMITRRIAQKWFGKPDGERQITNLRHLTELLQQRASVAPGMHRLLKWFIREKLAADTVAAEERQLRLESDRNLVQIVTMHAAKGLEYDIVMIPMTAFVAQERKDEPALFHDLAQGRFHALLDFSDDANHRSLSAAEKRAEDMRLLYVAITRARYRCYLGIPVITDLKKSAVARLLQLTDFEPDAIEQHLRTNFTSPLFSVDRIDRVTSTPFAPAPRTQSLAPPSPRPVVHDNWRLHSYTGVSRMIKTTEAVANSLRDVTPGFGDDDTAAPAEAGSRASRFTFPKGPRPGVALHTLLEDIEFDQPLLSQMPTIDQCLDRVGLTRDRREWRGVLADWASDMIGTELPAGCSLAAIDRGHRLDEMEFHFPLQTDARLIDVLKSAGYLDRTATLNTTRLQGMMTGLIDLVFESGGKYWLVDYKSNHLGSNPGDYAPEQLKDAVRHHQYDLQYLIYCVALNRYLGSRIAAYSYETHFGGVCYLFIRGMKPGTSDGIYFDRPDAAFIDRLDAILGGSS